MGETPQEYLDRVSRELFYPHGDKSRGYIAKVLNILSQPENEYMRFTSPEVGSLLQREDFGIPETSTAQYIPWQSIYNSYYPDVPLEKAMELSGGYIYPSRAKKERVPIDYLIGHEGSHLRQDLANIFPGRFFYEGIGSGGYLPIKNKNQTLPSAIEDWLLNYPPEERPQERLAHMRGLLYNYLKQK